MHTAPFGVSEGVLILNWRCHLVRALTAVSQIIPFDLSHGSNSIDYDSSHFTTYRDDLRLLLQLSEVIRPLLHHLCAWFQIEGVIVSSSDRVARGMRQLQLNVLVIVPLLMQNSGRHSAEAMAGHLGLSSPSAPKPSG